MANYDYLNSWFNKNLSTSPGKEAGRLKVDSQQTSFEEGVQFRFYDEWTADDEITQTQQVVYKFTTTNPINLFYRRLTVYQGGRWYRVYPDDGNVTFTGTLTDVDGINPVNSRDNTQATGVTFQRAIGEGIFITTSRPIDGEISVADTSAARAVPIFSPDEQKIGFPAGASAYVVLDHLGSNDDLQGLLYYAWEEIFD